MSALIEIKNISINATVTVNVEGVKSSVSGGLPSLLAALFTNAGIMADDDTDGTDSAATGEGAVGTTNDAPFPTIDPELAAGQTEVNVALDKADEEDEEGEEEAEDDEEAVSSAIPAATQPSFTIDLQKEVEAFITSDPRYTMRSTTAIREKFGDDGVVVAQALVAAGSLGTKVRRKDRVNLYFKATPASGNLKRDIIAFLTSDSRYNYRTKSTIFKVFAGAGVGAVSLALDEMRAACEVSTKTRQRDRAQLYCAKVSVASFDTAPAQLEEVVTEAAPAAEPEAVRLSVEDVRGFIGSNPKFASRSLDAIVKNFSANYAAAEVTGLVHAMVDDGDLGVITRRSDNVKLYKLA